MGKGESESKVESEKIVID